MNYFYDENDLVKLWKATMVELPDSDYMFVVYYWFRNRNNRKESFYKCNIKIDSFENWEETRCRLLEKAPADYFRTSMIGMEDDYMFFVKSRCLNKADFSRWIGTKFSKTKIISLKDFIEVELKKDNPYLNKYNIGGNEVDLSDPEAVKLIPKGLWFSTLREKVYKKTYGRIIY